MFIFSLGPCHKQKITFKLNAGSRGLTKHERAEYACFFPTVDYGQYSAQDHMV